jgi:hypothetical protein
MSGAWNAWKNLSRGSRFAIGASWIAVGAAGTYYQDTIEKRTLKFMGAGPAEKVDTTCMCFFFSFFSFFFFLFPFPSHTISLSPGVCVHPTQPLFRPRPFCNKYAATRVSTHRT